MGITIRKATEQDAALIASAMIQSSRLGKPQGIFDLIFETQDDEALKALLARLATASTKCYCHYSNFLIAESGGEAAGLLCNYEPRIATKEHFKNALIEIGVDAAYEERIAGYLLCEPEVNRQTWMLDVMVQCAGHESFEVVKELVQKSLLTARLKGYRKVQTLVEIGATQLQMVCEKLGFTFEDEKRSEYYKELFDRSGIMRYGFAL